MQKGRTCSPKDFLIDPEQQHVAATEMLTTLFLLKTSMCFHHVKHSRFMCFPGCLRGALDDLNPVDIVLMDAITSG